MVKLRVFDAFEHPRYVNKKVWCVPTTWTFAVSRYVKKKVWCVQLEWETKPILVQVRSYHTFPVFVKLQNDPICIYKSFRQNK